MDVQKKLDEIVSAVSGARSMPMSASCVVNRAELLALLEEVRQALPGSLAQAQELIGGREQMVEQARLEAERIIASAHAERGSLISDTEVARRSRDEADRILAEARRETEEVRAEADEYVDSKLANFEVVLTKTLGSVGRGREKLLGTGPGTDERGYEDEDAPERSHDPETLRRNADEYVDVKLGAFEAVLAKTLDAVGRGRQKLHGRIASDDLGDLAALGEEGTAGHTTDAEYLDGLAEIPEQSGRPLTAGRVRPPAAPSHQPQYGQQDAYAYQQQGDPYGRQQYEQQYEQQYGQQDGQQDGYGYQQSADPYAAYPQQGYDQQAAYGQSGQQAYDPSQQTGMSQDGTPRSELPRSRTPQPTEPQPHENALDETSLFDTGMISAEQLRAYEQGR